MISAILKRRYWVLKSKIYSLLGLLIMLPILLTVIVYFPIKNLIVDHQTWDVPFEQWILSGLVVLTQMMMLIPSVSRDLFELRIQKKIIPAIVLTPISKPNYLVELFVCILIESVFYLISAMLIFSILTAPGFNFLQYSMLFILLLLMNAIIINILITLSLLIDRFTIYLTSVLLLTLIIIFASGLIFDFSLFPENIANILKFSPIGLITQSVHGALFDGMIYWLFILGILIIILIWITLNSLLFTKRVAK